MIKKKRTRYNSLREVAYLREEVPFEELTEFMPKAALHHGKKNSSIWKQKQNVEHLGNQVWTAFLEELVGDFVEDNVRFIVPLKGYGMIMIMETDTNGPKQYPNIHSDGKIYQGQWQFKMNGIWTNIRLRFNEENKKILQEKIESGYHYWQKR